MTTLEMKPIANHAWKGRVVEEDRATGWIRSLPSSPGDLAEVRDALTGTRGECLKRVVDLELPHIPFIYTSVDTFLRQPGEILSQLRGEDFFLTIQPTDYAARVDSPSPRVASAREIVSLARQYSSDVTGVEFDIVVSEVRDIAYLGNITVAEGGEMYGEFSDEGIPPTRSGLKQVHRFQRDPYLGTFHYSFDDKELRRSIYDALQCLPYRGTGRNREWQKGYYELTLVRSPDNHLYPAFYDFRDSKSFLYAPAHKVL